MQKEGTQNITTQNKLKQLKSPGSVASYDLWTGKRVGLYSKKVSKEK